MVKKIIDEANRKHKARLKTCSEATDSLEMIASIIDTKDREVKRAVTKIMHCIRKFQDDSHEHMESFSAHKLICANWL